MHNVSYCNLMLCMRDGVDGSPCYLLTLQGNMSASGLCINRTNKVNPQRGSDLAVWFPFTKPNCTSFSSHVLKAHTEYLLQSSRSNSLIFFFPQNLISSTRISLTTCPYLRQPDDWSFLPHQIIQSLSLHANLSSILQPAKCKCKPLVLLLAASAFHVCRSWRTHKNLAEPEDGSWQ